MTNEKETQMTSQAVLKIKMIAALIENLEEGDAKDAEQAIKMIEALLLADKKS